VARDAVGPLIEGRVRHLLSTEHNRDLIWPRVSLRLEDFVEDREAGC